MLDLAKIKKIYVIGIKGSGVVALVEILQAMGIEVTGSDTHEKFFSDEVLQKLDIKYIEGFAVENISNDADLILYATCYNAENNVEFAEAKKRNLNMVSYPEMLGELFNKKYGIAVSGTHGKTTTSAMLADVLKKIGADPSAVIGSRVVEWGSNALIGQGEFFVIEADEFQNKLKLYAPKGVILTSVDWDHTDTFPTFLEYKKAFADFVAKIPKAGFLVVWGDSINTLDISKTANCDVLSYGFSEDCDYKIFNFQFSIFNEITNSKVQKFTVNYKGMDLGEFETILVGKHNALNAVAVIATCHKLNLDMEKVREAVANFQGTSRRFEYVGERNGAILIDDYGHHPEEIKATLKGAREIYSDKNIIAVFHPHSYSRTEALLQDFAQSFDDADQVLVLDIYGSARENSGNVSSKDLVDLINKYNRDKAEYVPTIDEVVNLLKDKIGASDIVISIGAGDVWKVTNQLKQ
jgi:UDP-N-acetylmuramate--alanine ligase